MINPVPLSAAVGRAGTSAAILHISAPRGGYVTVDGAVPNDLTVTPLDSQGAPVGRALPMRAGSQFLEKFAQLQVSHAAVANGGTFTLYVSEHGSMYDPGTRDIRQLFTIGSGVTDVVPARTFTNVKSTLLSLAGAWHNTTVAPNSAGKRIRLLAYSLQVPASYTRPALESLAIGIVIPGVGTIAEHIINADATGRAGLVVNTGVVGLGDGVLLPASTDVNVANTSGTGIPGTYESGIAALGNVTTFYNYES